MDPLLIAGLAVGGYLLYKSSQRAGEYYTEPSVGGQDYNEEALTSPMQDAGAAAGGGMMVVRPAGSAPTDGGSVSNGESIAAKIPTVLTAGKPIMSAAAAVAIPAAERLPFATWLSNRDGKVYNPASIQASAATLNIFRNTRGRIEALARSGVVRVAPVRPAMQAWWRANDPAGWAAWDKAVCPGVPLRRTSPGNLAVFAWIPRSLLIVNTELSSGRGAPVLTEARNREMFGYNLVPYSFGSQPAPSTVAQVVSPTATSTAQTGVIVNTGTKKLVLHGSAQPEPTNPFLGMLK